MIPCTGCVCRRYFTLTPHKRRLTRSSIKIQFSEIIDLTPDSSVVTSKIRISNTPGETSADSRIDLSGGQVVETDSTVLTLTFSENVSF